MSSTPRHTAASPVRPHSRSRPLRALAAAALPLVGLLLVPAAAAAQKGPDPTGFDNYRIINVSQNLPNGGDYFLQADCPAGSKVLAGGASVGRLGEPLNISQGYPRVDGSGWEVEGTVRGQAKLELSAICSNVPLEPDVQYRVVTRHVTIPWLQNVRFTIDCGGEDTAGTVLSGGIATSRRHAGSLMVSYPLDGGRGWGIEWETNALPLFTDASVVGRAVCMYVPTEHFDDVISGYEIVRKREEVSLPSLGWDTGKVDCPEGKRTLGGGVYTDHQTAVRTVDSYPATARGGLSGRASAWAVSFKNGNGASGQTATVMAVCASIPGIDFF